MATDENKYVTNAELSAKLDKLKSELRLWIVICTIAAPFAVPVATQAAPVAPAVADVAVSAFHSL